MHPYQPHQNPQPANGVKLLANGHQPQAERASAGRWLHDVIRRWQRRKMIATLRAMDDRMLRDIGLARAEIPRVVEGFSSRELRMVPLASELESPVRQECVEGYREAA